MFDFVFVKNEFIYDLSTSKLFYFNGAKNISIFGAKTHKISAKTNKIGAEIDIFKIGFYIGCQKGTKMLCHKRVPKLVDTT